MGKLLSICSEPNASCAGDQRELGVALGNWETAPSGGCLGVQQVNSGPGCVLGSTVAYQKRLPPSP